MQSTSNKVALLLEFWAERLCKVKTDIEEAEKSMGRGTTGVERALEYEEIAALHQEAATILGTMAVLETIVQVHPVCPMCHYNQLNGRYFDSRTNDLVEEAVEITKARK